MTGLLQMELQGLTLSQEDFPVRTLVLQEIRKDLLKKQGQVYGQSAPVYLGDIRPKYAIFENVTALLNGAGGDWFKRVLWDISEVGYDAEWHCISASELGAHHHRDRIWIIAYPNGTQCQRGRGEIFLEEEFTRSNLSSNHAESDESEGQQQGIEKGNRAIFDSEGKDICSDSSSIGQSRQGEYEQSLFAEAYSQGEASNAIAESSNFWKTESKLGRVADGIPNRSHRLKQLGNAVVPQIPELIGRAIMAANK